MDCNIGVVEFLGKLLMEVDKLGETEVVITTFMSPYQLLQLLEISYFVYQSQIVDPFDHINYFFNILFEEHKVVLNNGEHSKLFFTFTINIFTNFSHIFIFLIKNPIQIIFDIQFLEKM